MIFQLPYIPFPEHPQGQQDGRLRSFPRLTCIRKNLRWSYGTIKNHDGDRAQQQRRIVTSSEELVQTLAFAGFSGIYVDRFGYEDDGAAVESELI